MHCFSCWDTLLAGFGMKEMNLCKVLLMAALLVPAPAAAHHSFGAEYDSNKPITLTGSCHQGGVDEPAQLLCPGRERRQRCCGELEIRGVPAQCFVPNRLKRDVTMRPG